MSQTAGKPQRKSAADIIASASRPKPFAPRPNYKDDPRKQIWCDTVWTNLSVQAKTTHNLSTLPYFDPETMLLSREVNQVLWGQLVG
jgi:hypothetical protein